MPSLAELRKQFKEKQELESKKLDTIPEDKNVSDLKPKPKKLKIVPGTITDEKLISGIDQQLSEIVNKRVLKLINIGLKHELTIDNMFQYFREINKTKLYELKRYFSDSKLSEINDMLQYLYNTGVLTRDKNNWYSIKIKKRDIKNVL